MVYGKIYAEKYIYIYSEKKRKILTEIIKLALILASKTCNSFPPSSFLFLVLTPESSTCLLSTRGIYAQFRTGTSDARSNVGFGNVYKCYVSRRREQRLLISKNMARNESCLFFLCPE